MLEAHEAVFTPFHPAFWVIFNSYYNQVGDKYPRTQRGLLTRPSLDQVMAYRADVDARMVRLIDSGKPADTLRDLVTLVLQHQQQHQELMLTDFKHLFSCSPLYPSYALPATTPSSLSPQGAAPSWLPVAGGVVKIGHMGPSFCFDNELTPHRVFVQACALRLHLVSNTEYLVFVQDVGCANSVHWLSEG